MLYLNLVIRGIFWKLLLVYTVGMDVYCRLWMGWVNRQQEEERQTDRQSGCSLTLSWLHLTCHAVLFCCASHDNCLSGSIEFRDYSGWGEPRMRAETRQGSGWGKREWLEEAGGQKKIITAITDVGYLKLWLHNECKNSVGSPSLWHSSKYIWPKRMRWEKLL